MTGELRAAVGLEIHVQLATRSKLYCAAPTRADGPNEAVHGHCWGLPGMLPTLNGAAVDQALRLALALGCRVNEVSRFDRKHYFYADLPKGFQITQAHHPLAWDGVLEFPCQGSTGRLPVARLHLEEDAGRHTETGVDLNRAGLPLVELVTPPCLEGGPAASAALKALQALLVTLGVSHAQPEAGHLRVDANVSLPVAGTPGPRVEIKNVSGFNTLATAIDAEIHRQRTLRASGRPVERSTRRFDARRRITLPLRDKEAAADYRLMPEPDLPPVRIDAARLERLRAGLPELPGAKRVRWSELGIPEDAIDLLVGEPELAALFDRTGPTPELAHFMLSVVVARWRAEPRGVVEVLSQSPSDLARLVRMRTDGTLSSTQQKDVLDQWLTRKQGLADARAQVGGLIHADETLIAWVDQVLQAHPEAVRKLKSGKRGILGFLVGQVMARSGRRADPKRVKALIEARVSPSKP